ncbi:hypothetical protein, partial [Flaviflexus sp.]|uniref:hypothetical protein n=1 Tax=Flaviflexus sp. TaxID=1969482 RepID=UPI003F9370FB
KKQSKNDTLLRFKTSNPHPDKHLVSGQKGRFTSLLSADFSVKICVGDNSGTSLGFGARST